MPCDIGLPGEYVESALTRFFVDMTKKYETVRMRAMPTVPTVPPGAP